MRQNGIVKPQVTSLSETVAWNQLSSSHPQQTLLNYLLYAGGSTLARGE